MGKQNKKEKKEVAKTQLGTVGKVQILNENTPELERTEAPKLTKQQKRDLKRKSQINTSISTLSNGIARSKDIKENTSVYRRPSVFPPEFSTFKGHKDRFVRPTDKQFADIVKTSYNGFVLGKPEVFKPAFHDSFRSALELLETDNFYQFDLTQPTGLGTKVAKTFVTRCLVGDPGITYKYLGLRMFGHPWTEGEVGATQATIDVGKRNQDLIQHTEKLLKESGREEVGSCQYNLTLINRCFPDGCDKVVLKEEPLFKKEKCTVSWHADSSLDHYSTIGVYHCTKEREVGSGPVSVKPQKFNDKKHKANGTIPSAASANSGLWELSMRLHFNAEGPNAGKPVVPFGDVADNSSKITPALAVPLPDQHSYFLLDDFNHHHQHSGIDLFFDFY
jgi:alpha-ketoglutarate-dependent dioxygenase FTO